MLPSRPPWEKHLNNFFVTFLCGVDPEVKLVDISCYFVSWTSSVTNSERLCYYEYKLSTACLTWIQAMMNLLHMYHDGFQPVYIVERWRTIPRGSKEIIRSCVIWPRRKIDWVWKCAAINVVNRSSQRGQELWVYLFVCIFFGGWERYGLKPLINKSIKIDEQL